MSNIKVVDSIRSSVDGLKQAVLTGNKEAEAKWQKRFDELEFQVKRVATVEPKTTRGEEAKTFGQAVRLFGKGGIAAVNAKMEGVKVTSNTPDRQKSTLVRYDIESAGALLMPYEMSSDINKQIVEISPVMQVAKVVNTSAPSYRQAQRNTSLSASWFGEASTLAKTNDTFGFEEIPVHDLGARVAFSIQQEQDSAFDIENEITTSIREQFEKALGTAFINGDGVNKPKGIVGNVTSYTAGGLALTTDMLIRLTQQIKTHYQRNGSWMVNRLTMAYIRSLVLSSTNGLEYTWEPNFQAGMPSRLLGAPVYEAPDLVGLVSGNFVSGQAPVLYGDFNYGYLIPRHSDFYMIRDPYTEGAAFVTNLYAMTRVGGAVVRSEAIAQLTMGS